MKIYRIITVALAGLLLCSCNSILEKTPLVNLAVENYYTNDDQANTAIIGVYHSIKAGELGTYHYIHLGDNISDDTEIGNGRSDGVKWAGNQLTMMKYDILPSNQYSGNYVWNYYFTTVSNANYVIGALKDSKLANAAKYTAEALFLRSFAYFDLARQFGGLPIVDHVLSYDEYFNPRETEDATWEFVENGFIEAEKDLPVSWDSANLGRVTKGAALAMLARTYVYHASYLQFHKKTDASTIWQKAYDTIKMIELSNYFTLEPKFEDIFSMTHQNGIEHCFSIQFATSHTGWGVANDGNNSCFYGHDFGITTTDLDKNATTLHDYYGEDIYDFVYNKMLEEFPWNINDDGSPKAYLKKWTGWSLHCPTLDLVAAFEPGDPRLAATVIAPNEYYDGHTHFNLASPSRYQGKKDYVPFEWRTEESNEDDLPKNQIVLRWGNVLLYMAEACNELGKTVEALEYLEKVRGRARSNSIDPTVLPKVTTTDQAELREAIYHERRVENALEYDRYFDLARTGRLEATMKAYYAKYKNDRGKFEKGKNVQSYHEHMPIPQRAIDASLYNGVYTLEQNPGY
ncbi:MAG: RagB/SusD family nutrient uptake outer membrane protein [Candidatus Cryptobacteroides sp.]|jgi:hypothetical protein